MRGLPTIRIAVVAACFLAIGIGVAWTYWPMRAVMDVGGYCAEGGPYVIETHCPEGSTLFLTLGPMLWMLGVFVGFIALSIRAPLPVFPGWALLFGALGWNFVDYALHADPGGAIVGSWLVCGIMFWVMALPGALIFFGWPLVSSWFGSRRVVETDTLRSAPATTLLAPAVWVPIDLALLAVGFWLGTLIAL